MRASSLTRNDRRAFSLLELIIVLMIMVGLMAIAWPNLQKPLRRTPLLEAAATIRQLIDDCRVEAANRGNPMVLQLKLGSSALRRGALTDFASDTDTSLSSPASASGTSDPEYAVVEEWQLPPGVVVASAHGSLTIPVVNENDAEKQDVVADEVLEVGKESQPIHLIFLPGGQSRDTTLELLDTSSQEAMVVRYWAATGDVELTR